ncbi:hypothetical protein BD408DRAFT_420192 [Parasitella parasitica]|nr:hypothetical protein BD408DRAFT_420192 [Parasitella parasitica]
MVLTFYFYFLAFRFMLAMCNCQKQLGLCSMLVFDDFSFSLDCCTITPRLWTHTKKKCMLERSSYFLSAPVNCKCWEKRRDKGRVYLFEPNSSKKRSMMMGKS